MKSLVFIILAFHASCAYAQHDLREILTASFFEKNIYDKVFIEYKGGDATFMSGYKQPLIGAFVFPDTNMQRHFPLLLDVVGTSHANERQFMTSTFISHPKGKVFFTSNILDPAIRLFVNFDSISITKKKSCLNFHTTGRVYHESLKDNYVRVECEMVRKRRGWKVKRIKITPIQCCSKF